jgi:hypothetical protein
MACPKGGWVRGVSSEGLLLAAAAVVCSGQVPFSDSANYAAKAETVAGQVSVLRDSQPWAISAGDMVQVQQMIFTGPDGYALFRVSDGSTFEVYPNSRVVFRKTPNNWRDLLDVLLGRVRIRIQHFGATPNPNRVLTPTAVISVRGTTFDVEVSDDDETTLIEVEDGVVEVRHALLPGDNATVLQTGQSIRVYRSQPLQARWLDKGTVARQVLRAVMDAITTVGSRGGRGGGVGVPGGGPTTGGTVGDSDKTTPPPPPPPPLPPLN